MEMTVNQMKNETLMIGENMKAAVELMVRGATGMVETGGIILIGRRI